MGVLGCWGSHCFISPSKGGAVPRKLLCANGGWSQSCPFLGHSTQTNQGYTNLCICQDWPLKWWKPASVYRKALEHRMLVFVLRKKHLNWHFHTEWEHYFSDLHTYIHQSWGLCGIDVKSFTHIICIKTFKAHCLSLSTLHCVIIYYKKSNLTVSGFNLVSLK